MVFYVMVFYDMVFYEMVFYVIVFYVIVFYVMVFYVIVFYVMVFYVIVFYVMVFYIMFLNCLGFFDQSIYLRILYIIFLFICKYWSQSNTELQNRLLYTFSETNIQELTLKLPYSIIFFIPNWKVKIPVFSRPKITKKRLREKSFKKHHQLNLLKYAQNKQNKYGLRSMPIQ